jgi:hypothetical protein
MKSFRPLFMSVSPEVFRESFGKESKMSVMGIAPAGSQVSAAVFDVSAVVKPPPEKRDDVVPPIKETTNGNAARADLSLMKMNDPAVGQTVDVRA